MSTEISAITTGGVKYSLKDATARSEISGKIKIAVGDAMQFQESDLSICKISQAKYAEILAADQASDKCLYVVSSDNASMYGQRITDVGTPTADSDAATKSYVDTNSVKASDFQLAYTSSDKKIHFKVKGSDVSSPIDCSDFIKDGMLSTATMVGNTLVLKFNTDGPSTPISVNLSQFVDNYDAKITGLSNAITADVKNLADNYYQKSDVTLNSNGQIKVGTTTITALTAHQSLTNYYTKSETNGLSTTFRSGLQPAGNYLSVTDDHTTSAQVSSIAEAVCQTHLVTLRKWS